MKISEIQEEENNNPGYIMLRREGLFWRAYELSAYLFVRHLKEYAVTHKFYKTIGAEMVYIGFPHSGIGQIKTLIGNLGGLFSEHSDIMSVIELPNATVDGYIMWREAVLHKKTMPVRNLSSETEPETYMTERIRLFPVASKTPLEAMSFIVELQNKINGALR